MNPLPPLPPALDPFAGLGPLAPPLEPVLRLLRLPFELLYYAFLVATSFNNPNGLAAWAPLGALLELLLLIFVVALVVVPMLAVLFGLGFGTLLATAVIAFKERIRRESRLH